MADYCISETDLNRLEQLITLLATDIHAYELRQINSRSRRNPWDTIGSVGVIRETFPNPFDPEGIDYRHSEIIKHLDNIIDRIRASRLDLVTHKDYPNLIPAPIPELDRFADLDLTED